MKKLYWPALIILINLLFLSAACLVAKETGETAPPLEVADHIHFSIISNTALTFDWTGTADHICYGTDPHNLNTVVKGAHPEFLPVTSPWVSDPGPYWEAKLTGLSENTSYYYRIGESGKMYRFHTPPPPGVSGFRVCTTSDMHDRSTESVVMFYQIALEKPDLIITTGSYFHEGWQEPVKPSNCAFRAIQYGVLVLDFTDKMFRGRLLCSVPCMTSGDPDYMPLEEDYCDEPGTVIDAFTIEAGDQQIENE